MTTNKPQNITEYISGFPEETQQILEQLRHTIKKSLPDSTESISYGVPAFAVGGKAVIYFAGYKNHVAVYPAPRENEAFEEELSKYKGGKGTVQFPLNKPIPFDLVTRIAEFRLQENLARAKKAKPKK